MDPVRRDFLRRSARAAGLATLALPWAGWPIAARAANLKRLGILSIFGREDSLELFRTGGEKHLAQRGWVVGNTLAIEWRFAQKDMSRLGPLARELVEARVDAICTWGTSATRAVQQATRAIPIVTGVTDPVGYGFAKSLARPGGNFTGLSYLTPEVMRKELELLRGLLPKLAQLVYVTRSPLESIQERARATTTASREAGIHVQFRRVETRDELEAALRTMPAEGHSAVDLDWDLSSIPGLDDRILAQMAIQHRIPALYDVEPGGLMAYRLEYDDVDARFMAIVDKVLRGQDPAVIPFETPTKLSFGINRRTAEALGIRIPPEMLLRADRIID